MHTTYRAIDFPASAPSTLQGQHQLLITWEELFWAAITVGRYNLSAVVRHGPKSLDEVLYRILLLSANLDTDPNDHVVMSEVFQDLDPSEKGAVSFFSGMTMAKVLASRLLGVQRLLHLDAFKVKLPIALQPGMARPDFVGRDANGAWAIAESKGRTSGRTAALARSAKAQTQRVRTVAGAVPRLRVAFVTYFTASGGLRAVVCDPEEPSDDAVDLEITELQFLQHYYEPMAQIVAEQSEPVLWGNIWYRFRHLESVDVWMGMPDRFVERIHSEGFAAVVASFRSPGTEAGELEWRPERAALQPLFRRKTHLGGDGVALALGASWNSDT